MTVKNTKNDARNRVNQLPNGSSRNDLIHEIYVRQTIEAGQADSQNGHTKDVAEVRK